jgi:hypothetical protein
LWAFAVAAGVVRLAVRGLEDDGAAAWVPVGVVEVVGDMLNEEAFVSLGVEEGLDVGDVRHSRSAGRQAPGDTKALSETHFAAAEAAAVLVAGADDMRLAHSCPVEADIGVPGLADCQSRLVTEVRVADSPVLLEAMGGVVEES